MAGCRIRRVAAPGEIQSPVEQQTFCSSGPVLSVDQAVFRMWLSERRPFALRSGVELSRVSNAPPQGLERSQERKSGRSENRRRGTPGDEKRLWTASQPGAGQHCRLNQES